MATSSARLLTLLSLLTARRRWSGPELARTLGVSTRSLRRDVGTLRGLGYGVRADLGPDGGYRLEGGSTLPPLLLDDEQALAVAVALQTAPTCVSGLDDAIARALASITGVLPPPLRAQAEAVRVTTVRNHWEFAAPPVPSATLSAVGHAVRTGQVLRCDYLAPDGRRPALADPDFAPPLRLEPHHLVMWAGRWYLVAFSPASGAWGVYRVDRIHPYDPTGIPFEPRELPDDDVAQYVRRTADRGDTTAQWPCVGTVLICLPAEVVARWVPGGSVVEPVSPTRSRFTVGAWSWAGVAGLVATFDADVEVLGPPELADACRALAARFAAASP